jgi:hypothetical protein
MWRQVILSITRCDSPLTRPLRSHPLLQGQRVLPIAARSTPAFEAVPRSTVPSPSELALPGLPPKIAISASGCGAGEGQGEGVNQHMWRQV